MAQSFAFTPNRVSVKAGITLSEQLDTKPRLVRFTATKPGSYEFFCDHSFGKSHRSMGMLGTLEVLP